MDYRIVSQQGACANIPPKQSRKDPTCFSPISTGRIIWWSGSSTRSKQCGCLGTRYARLAANYLAFIELASIRLWLRAYESTP